MAYQSLYRRYRPQTFAEVRGQQHLVDALRNAVRDDRVGHAYLFSGPRGTGKTTTARILAKALNCPNLVDGEPCDTCESCRAIAEGSSLDVFELDAASNNGVDAIRELIDRASQGSPGRHKVYILDEVHMLSPAASNALLKTLEEPPPHVVFVLATTDPQKVLATIKSRTQHYEVHLLASDDLEALVDDTIARAELDVPDGTRQYVLREGGGSARDTLSALDRVAALGAIPDEGDTVDELVEALCAQDTGRALAGVEAGMAAGRAPRTLGEALMARLRDVFLASVGTELRRLSADDRARVADQAERLGPRGATHALEVLAEAFTGIADAPDPRIPLEVALVRLTRPALDASPAALLGRIERLEQGRGASPPSPAPAATTAPAESTTGTEPAAAEPTTGSPEPEPAGSASAPDDPPPRAEAAQPPAGAGGGADAARQALAAKRSGRNGGDGGRARAAAAPAAAATDGPSEPPPRIGRSAPAPAAEATDDGGRPPTPAPEPGPAGAGTADATPDGPAAAGPDERSTPDTPTPGATAPATDGDAAAATGPGPAGGGPAAAGGTSSALPTRDELVLAWGDVVLGALPQKAKVRYAGGRFVDVVDDQALFGLPNDVHRTRCEELRPEVEQALAEHFGRPVPLRLVVDDGAAPPRKPGDARPDEGGDADAGPADEADVDVTELVDADEAAVDEVGRIAEVFGEVQIVEEDQR